jgi:transposase
VFPDICRQANAVGAVIYFEDESSISLNVFTGKTWAPRGKTPVVRRSGQRIKRTMASAVSIEGRLYFQTLGGSMTGPRYKSFLQALSRTTKDPIFVIHDGLPAHRAKVVTEYVGTSGGKICLFQLPGYSPELNPDELVWTNLKRELGKRAHKNIDEMSDSAKKYLRSLKRDKNTIKSFVMHVYGPICSAV